LINKKLIIYLKKTIFYLEIKKKNKIIFFNKKNLKENSLFFKKIIFINKFTIIIFYYFKVKNFLNNEKNLAFYLFI
jgi:hypothetical protein